MLLGIRWQELMKLEEMGGVEIVHFLSKDGDDSVCIDCLCVRWQEERRDERTHFLKM